MFLSQQLMKNWGGAYTGRYITVSYAPFGNSRLKAITDRFNLTILSEIFEGTFEYTKEVDKKIIRNRSKSVHNRRKYCRNIS